MDPGLRGCNPIDRLQPVSRKPGRFGELLWYRLRKHKLASVQKLFFWTRDSRYRTKLLRSFPWAELDYILLRRGDEKEANFKTTTLGYFLGDYRVLFSVDEAAGMVTIELIRGRGDVYKR